MIKKRTGDIKYMTEVVIPKEDLMIGHPVAVNVLKYSAEHGIEKGLKPISPMTMMVNGKTVTYADAMNITVAKGIEIKIVQE